MMERVKLFFTDDESLKLLGELLSNKTSRSMLTKLSNKAYYTNQLAKELGLSVSLTLHHLKKIEELGLVEIKNQQIVKNGVDRRFFKLKYDIFISKKDKEVTEKTGRLGKIFKDGIKFAMIGAASIVSYIATLSAESDKFEFASQKEINLTYPFLIIIIGLVAERIISKIKKRK